MPKQPDYEPIIPNTADIYVRGRNLILESGPDSMLVPILKFSERLMDISRFLTNRKVKHVSVNRSIGFLFREIPHSAPEFVGLLVRSGIWDITSKNSPRYSRGDKPSFEEVAKHFNGPYDLLKSTVSEITFRYPFCPPQRKSK